MISKQLIEAYKRGIKKRVPLKEGVWVPKDYGPDHLFWNPPTFLNVSLSDKVARETFKLKQEDEVGGAAYEGALLLQLLYKYWKQHDFVPWYEISKTAEYSAKILPGLEATKVIDEAEKKKLVGFVKALNDWCKKTLKEKDERTGRGKQTYERKEKIKAEQERRSAEMS